MQQDIKGKGKITTEVIKKQMQKKWVKKNPSLEGNEPTLEANSGNSLGN